MGIELATAFVTIRGELGHLRHDMSEAIEIAKRSAEGVAGTFERILGAIGVGLGLRELVAVGREAIAEGKEAELAETRLAQALEATGHAAGFTAEQLAEYNEELAKRGIFENTEYTRAAAALAIHKQISGEIFKRTLVAAADIAAQRGGSVSGTATMLGRAIEDPARGAMMLRRLHVDINEEQRKEIKNLVAAGELTAAQAIILDAIEKSYKGANEAIAATPVGHLMQLQNELKDMREHLGKELIPAAAVWVRLQMQWQKIIGEILPPLATFVGLLVALNEHFGGLPLKVAAVVVGVVALTVAIRALGITSIIWGVISTGISFVTTAFSLLLTVIAGGPGVLALFIAALGLLVAFGPQLASAFSAGFKTLTKDLASAWSGIKGALQGGDLALAAQIGFGAVKLEFTKLMDVLLAAWDEFMVDVAAAKDIIAPLVEVISPGKGGAAGGIAKGIMSGNDPTTQAVLDKLQNQADRSYAIAELQKEQDALVGKGIAKGAAKPGGGPGRGGPDGDSGLALGAQLGSGRFGFKDFGSKLQDVLLKREGGKTVEGLLEHNNSVLESIDEHIVGMNVGAG